MGNKLFYRVSLPVFALALAGLFPMEGGAQTIRPSTQKELKIYDPSPSGTGNIGLRAASGTSSYSLTLPTSAPAANQVLGVSSSSGGVATLTWTTVSVSAVSTFSGGTTGLTPSTATSGAVTLAGTLSVTNGGTGATSLTGIALGNGTGAFTGITTSSGIAGALSDETGSGALVFGTSPTVTTLTVASGGATISAGGLTVTAGGASISGTTNINTGGSAATSIGTGSTAGTVTIGRTGGTIATIGAISHTGDITASSNITALAFYESSDLRLKEVIKRDGDLIYFKWKDRKDDLIHIGYAAQEVQLNNPDQVRVDQAGMLAVNYIELLAEKVRVLEKEIEKLKKKKNRSYEKKK